MWGHGRINAHAFTTTNKEAAPKSDATCIKIKATKWLRQSNNSKN